MAKTVKTWGYHVLIAIDQLFKRPHRRSGR